MGIPFPNKNLIFLISGPKLQKLVCIIIIFWISSIKYLWTFVWALVYKYQNSGHDFCLGSQILKYLLFGPLQKNFAKTLMGSTESTGTPWSCVTGRKVTLKRTDEGLRGRERLERWMSLLPTCKGGWSLWASRLMWEQIWQRLWATSLKMVSG